jgi:hypothetical protein
MRIILSEGQVNIFNLAKNAGRSDRTLAPIEGDGDQFAELWEWGRQMRSYSTLAWSFSKFIEMSIRGARVLWRERNGIEGVSLALRRS